MGAADTKPQSRTKRFRPDNVKRMEPNAMRRQAALAQIAWHHLRDSATVICFMNLHDDELGARPIDVAIASDEGLSRVLSRLEAVATTQF
ncbi:MULTISPECIES: hypothetical protein [Sphingomonas]|uniref:hypothetical protein n=1 Tax=Sphingomonas TaxID=13687 RepID=UPI000DDAE00B|nr:MULTISPECIES: hypothetical protein [Sphingomonas]